MSSYLLEISENGEILGCMSGPDFVLKAAEEDLGELCLRVDDTYVSTTHYVQKGKVIEKPKRPNDYYEFCYDKKQWVADMELGKKFKLAEIDKAYEETVHEGFEVDGKQYSSTKEAQTQIQLAVSMQHETCAVTMLDGTCSMVTADEIKIIGAAMLKHLSDCIQRRSTAVAAINDATSVEDLEKVVF